MSRLGKRLLICGVVLAVMGIAVVIFCNRDRMPGSTMALIGRVSMNWPGIGDPNRDRVVEKGKEVVPDLIYAVQRRSLYESTFWMNFRDKLPPKVNQFIPSGYQLTHQRHIAIWLLGEMGEGAKDAVGALENVRLRSGRSDDKAISTIALARIQPKNTAAISNLVSALGSKQQTERFYASLHVGGFQDAPDVVLDALTQAMNDSDGEVRANSCWSVAQFGVRMRKVVPKLKELLLDNYRHVSSAAAYALVRVAPEEAGVAIDTYLANRANQTDMVGMYGAHIALALPPGATNAVPWLRSSLVSPTGDMPVQVAAIGLLRVSRVTTPEIVMGLGAIRSVAEIRSISELGPLAVDAIPRLESLVQSGDRSVREAAVAALESITGKK